MEAQDLAGDRVSGNMDERPELDSGRAPEILDEKATFKA
jgi:hypothetical protein